MIKPFCLSIDNVYIVYTKLLSSYMFSKFRINNEFVNVYLNSNVVERYRKLKALVQVLCRAIRIRVWYLDCFHAWAIEIKHFEVTLKKLVFSSLVFRHATWKLVFYYTNKTEKASNFKSVYSLE